MKAVVRSSIVSIVALFGILSVSVSAQAYFSSDQARERSTADVVSGEQSYAGDIIRIAHILPVSRSPILVWKGESGVEGHEDIQYQSQGVTKEPGQHSRWASGKQYDTDKKRSDDSRLFRGWKSEQWLNEYKYDHDRGYGMPEEHGHNRHWVKKDADPAPTPIPSAALLLGSGLSIMMIGRSVKFSKGLRRGELC